MILCVHVHTKRMVMSAASTSSVKRRAVALGGIHGYQVNSVPDCIPHFALVRTSGSFIGS